MYMKIEMWADFFYPQVYTYMNFFRGTNILIFLIFILVCVSILFLFLTLVNKTIKKISEEAAPNIKILEYRLILTYL